MRKMKLLLVSCVLVTMLAVLASLSGCAGTSKPEGTLTVAVPSFHTEIFWIDQTTGQSTVQQIYEYLVHMEPDGKLGPYLAERWQMSPDGKTWTFFLRKGVQFHDGWGEMTAEDVKFSVEEGSRKGSINTIYVTWGRVLSNIEIVNPYEIRFHFTQPYVLMAEEASDFSPRAGIASKKYFEAVGREQAGRKPIGTGPYKFSEHKQGAYVILEAVENHWRGTPGFKYLKMVVVPEPATVVQMLKAGDIDIASINAANVDEIKAAGLKIIQSKGGSDIFVGLGGLILKDQWPKQWDPTIPWVGDPANPASLEKAYKVRLALNLAIDKESIARNILKGTGFVNVLPLYYPGDPWTDSKWKPVPYDPNKAKTLLAEAGYPNGLEFEFWTFAQPGRQEIPEIAQAVAMMWQQIGVKTRIRLTDSEGMRPTQTERKLGYAAQTEGVPQLGLAPGQMYNVYFYGKKGTGRYKGLEDPRLIDFQDKIVAEVDQAKRYELIKQRGQLMIDNSWIIPLVHKNLVFAASPKVAKWTPVPLSQYGGNFEFATPAK